MKSYVSHESYYNCTDGCSILKLTQYNTAGNPEPQIELAIYPMFPKYRNWIQQLKWIWQIITKQCVWDDQIILDVDEMERLSRNISLINKGLTELSTKDKIMQYLNKTCPICYKDLNLCTCRVQRT